MKARLLLALAVWCAPGIAQLPRPQAPRPVIENPDKHQEQASTETVQVDAVVTDAAGHSVPGLSAGDFEVTMDDKPQKLSGVTYMDGSRNRRFVFVVDDLELSVRGVAAARQAIGRFLETSLRPEDRVAIVGTSRASASEARFKADRAGSLRALDAIQSAAHLLGQPDRDGAARGALCQLRMVADSLRDEPGRKSVVFFSAGLRSAGNGGGVNSRSFAELLDAASRASVVLYQVDPEEPVAEASVAPADPKAAAPFRLATRSLAELQTGMPDVARRSGGLLFESASSGALERIANDADGYYRLTYPIDRFLSELGAQRGNLAVRVTRSGLNVRAGDEAMRDDAFHAESSGRLTRDAATIPFSDDALDLEVTPLFENQASGSFVNALIHLNLRNVTTTQDLKGMRESQVELAIATLGANGSPLDLISNTLTLRLPAADYDAAIRNGVSFAMRLPLHRTSRGGWQFLAFAADDATGRTGGATEYIEIPDLAGGGLAVSGLVLEGEDAAKRTAGENAPGASGTAAVRIFRPGETLHYNCSVYNVAGDQEKRSRIELQVRLFRNGEQVYEGSALPLSFPPSDSFRRRSLSGSLKLTETMPPGQYYFQLSLKDKLAAAGKPANAIQYTRFEVRR
jgi:VWFA-related protein